MPREDQGAGAFAGRREAEVNEEEIEADLLFRHQQSTFLHRPRGPTPAAN
jgi:hypothetical protein